MELCFVSFYADFCFILHKNETSLLIFKEFDYLWHQH